MSLESAAYIAEILAAAAVIPSLIYLSIQVRQSNRQTSAEARYGWVEPMADINIAVAQDKQAASVWRRGLEDPKQLDGDVSPTRRRGSASISVSRYSKRPAQHSRLCRRASVLAYRGTSL